MCEKGEGMSVEFKGVKKWVSLGDGKWMRVDRENGDGENRVEKGNVISGKERRM